MSVHFVVGIDETLIDLKSPGAGYSLITIDLWPSVIAELARTEVSVYDYSTAVQQRPLLLTWINLNPSMDKKVTTCPVKYGMKLLILSQTLNVSPLKFWEWMCTFIVYFIMDEMTYPSWD